MREFRQRTNGCLLLQLAAANWQLANCYLHSLHTHTQYTVGAMDCRVSPNVERTGNNSATTSNTETPSLKRPEKRLFTNPPEQHGSGVGGGAS
uniref:Putative secreted protein n=1 Tax=Anopheles marajoara TaxID=58244 RepID=A0A2M4C9M5_9DIPT